MARATSTGMPRIDGPRYEQLSLFGDQQRAEPAPGSLDISARVRATLKAAIKACPLSRHHVAAAMSDALDRDITKAQLDAWTAPAHEAQGHRFPLEYVPAFCAAVGDYSLLDLLAEIAGGQFVRGPHLLDYEIGQLAAQEARLRDRKNKLLAKARQSRFVTDTNKENQ